MPTNTAAWIGARQAKLAVKPAPYTSPRENEIVVKNHAVAINPVDWIIQVTSVYRWITYPFVLGSFDTNAIGVIRVTQAALPLLEKSDNPVVVNVSSALGSFWAVTNPARRQFHYPAIIYGASKAAVSMLTVQYAKARPEIKFNAVEPGFTATDLTPASGAGQPVEKGAEVIVRMATIGKDGPTGAFQENGGELAW